MHESYPQKYHLLYTRTDAAFGGWCEACGAKLASLAFQRAFFFNFPKIFFAEKFRLQIFFVGNFFPQGGPLQAAKEGAKPPQKRAKRA